MMFYYNFLYEKYPEFWIIERPLYVRA